MIVGCQANFFSFLRLLIDPVVEALPVPGGHSAIRTIVKSERSLPCYFDSVELHSHSCTHEIINTAHCVLRSLDSPNIVSFSPYSNFGLALNIVPKL